MERSDRSEGPFRPVAVQNGDDPTNARPGGNPSGQARVGLPRLGRPVRASSNAMETREEQYIEIGKEKVKKIKRFVFDLLDTLIGRDPLYL